MKTPTPENQDDTESGDRYLVFRLGDEAYATSLLGVREVLEFQTPKPIPNAIAALLGVINIRGQIIGVLDLRLRFGIPAARDRGSMMVFDLEGDASAAA